MSVLILILTGDRCPTKEDLAHYFFEQELDAVIEWYQQDSRIQRTALPEKLFAIIQQSLDRLTPYEDFLGAIRARARSGAGARQRVLVAVSRS